jgi:hypothetical protein
MESVANSDAIVRRELHHRRIEMRGYSRSDGLYEVEGRVVDRKPHAFTPLSHGGKPVAAGEAVHDMGVRLVFDEHMVVHDVQTFTDSAPYEICPEGGRPLQVLKGLKLTKGWGQEVRRRLGGATSCAHLRELLVPMATTAFQSLTLLRMGRPDAVDAHGRPTKIDSCYAYAAHGEIVRMRWPGFHRPVAGEE